ncbi:hypothetical protein BN1051_02851 [Arthrobacter saudimassiliensis]|uniref:Asp23/Gls24 family envelope stress response protein n=1 Tax=Arthrobacter saudimassiliensis TaxID=1461584 RepID=A0A078MXD1_9MICC|nr:hypothetical protein BN1051_02851 [Arthrobacter saudimassiliensis]
MARQVLEKIAGQVTADETAAGGGSGGFLGFGSSADLSARPRTSVELAGNIASLQVEVGMPYPVPLRAEADRLRGRLTARIGELTGVEVRQVDILIRWLQPPRADGARRRLL